MPGMTRTGDARDDKEREYPDDEDGGIPGMTRRENTRMTRMGECSA